MYDIARWGAKERAKLFLASADALKLNPAIIEKDFWACCILDILFKSKDWGAHLMFKGGTSLSKVFGVIERFSEDIDMILDWNIIGCSDSEAWKSRSHTQDSNFAARLNAATAGFLKNRFIASLNLELELYRLPEVSALIDEHDPQCVLIRYPYSFKQSYVMPELRLEIGPLADWVPYGNYTIKPYIVDAIPQVFKQPTGYVRAIKAERTFWEKATILHREAQRPTQSTVPNRYSRHYYDLAMMTMNVVKVNSLNDFELLKSVVAFKQRFYSCAWAKYDDARPGTMKLLPPSHSMKHLMEDYEAMKEMIFHEPVSFEWIIEQLTKLEQDINS